MSGSRLVRGTRSRLFLYLGVVAVVGLAVYVFHGAQLQLDDARKVADKCQQQQESLSAQLQVIFEYKMRLEKSLQQEKTEHRQTREELESKATEEKTRRDKENLESTNKYAALQQQYKLLQSQHEDLSEDCKKVRVEQLHGLEERSKLELQVQAVQAELEQVQASHKKSLSSLKTEYMKLEVENDQLQKQRDNLKKGTTQSSDRVNFLEKQNIQLRRELEKIQKELDSYKLHRPVKRQNEEETLKSPDKPVPASSSSSAAPDVGVNMDNQNVLQQPLENEDVALNKVGGGLQTTTPQINPQAVLSQDRGQQQQQANNVAPVPPPRQEETLHDVPNLPRPAVVDPGNNWQHGIVPAGVVPAPHGYVQDVAANRNEEQNIGNRGPWAWPRFRHGPQPIEVHNNNINNPLDDNGPEEEEDEEDPAHPHRNGQGEQQEIPRQLQNSYQYNGADLQVEEGEEEEDDDVDQVDYANDAGVRHNKVNKQPVVKKQHDSVMVNPK